MAITEIRGNIPWYPYDNTDKIVESSLYWSSGSPLEIIISFGPVPWAISRELISEALATGEEGEGDVHVKVADGTILLRLHSPYGKVELRTGAAFLAAFLKKTYAEIDQLTEADQLPLTDLDLRLLMQAWKSWL